MKDISILCNGHTCGHSACFRQSCSRCRSDSSTRGFYPRGVSARLTFCARATLDSGGSSELVPLVRPPYVAFHFTASLSPRWSPQAPPLSEVRLAANKTTKQQIQSNQAIKHNTHNKHTYKTSTLARPSSSPLAVATPRPCPRQWCRQAGTHPFPRARYKISLRLIADR